MSVVSSSNRLEAADASSPSSAQRAIHPSVHRWALVMVCMTFPLIWVGGLVTTYDAGMAVPDWPGTYGYNLFLYPISTWLFGPFDLFVEHGHRLLASLVGLIAIGFLYSTLQHETRPWMKAWAVFMLAAVISQGLLGGFRVLKDARAMAMIHGCTASAFFGLAAATAVMTSPWWIAAGQATKDAASRASKVPGMAQGATRRKGRVGAALFYLLPAAAFCQLVIGAQLRHVQPWTPPSRFTMWVHLHLTLAGVVTLLILWVAYRSRSISRLHRRKLTRPATFLLLLVFAQLGLGFATWISNYAMPWQDVYPWLARYTIQSKGFTESWIVTGHQAIGSLIIAISTVIACRLGRDRYLHVD